MKHSICALALTTLASSLLAEPEVNQEVIVLPELIVTSDLWNSTLEDSTASVSILEESTLRTNGIQHFEDVANSIANLTWTGGSSRPRYIQIRGIGENSQFEGETPDASVRFLIDDFDLTGLGTVGNLFDVQQVEVLRGPQAGAYGANAAGGIVQIVTNQPTAYWTGQVEAGIGNDNLLTAGIAVGGPLIESSPEVLTFRASIQQHQQDGFRENQFLNEDETNERDELSSQLKLRWKPNQDWTVNAALLYADVDNGYDEFTLSNDRIKTFSDQPGRDEQETFGTSLSAEFLGFDEVILTSTSSYVDSDGIYSFDGDWTDPSVADGLYGSSFLEIFRERDVYTQDFRIDSSDTEDALGFIDRWTAGIYYQQLEENTVTTGFGDFETDYLSETLSFYGQATHDLSDSSRITLGLRAEYFDLETEMDFREDVDFDDWLFGGKLTFEQDLGQAHTAYVSITKGYKVGGANIYPFLDTPTLPDQYDTEDLWNYELGLRSEWFDGAVETKVTLFYLDRENAQLRDSEGENVSFTYFTTNGDGAKHLGLEAEASWQIDANWTVSASLGLLDAERDSYTDPSDDSLSIGSRELANAPKYSYSARLAYRPLNGFFASVEAVGSDEYFESNSHEEKRNAYAVINGSLGYRFDHWTVTVWGKNLFDEAYEERVFFFDNGFGDERYEAPAAPRSFGVTANYSW